MNIKKYNKLPLIKSDTDENLKDYWVKAYSNDSLEYLLKRFEDNLTFSLMASEKFKSVFVTGYIKQVVFEKTEIYITHILVLNDLINKIKNIECNPVFDELLVTLQNCKETNAILNKINQTS